MYEEAAAQIALKMIRKYGQVLEVSLKEGGAVEVLFEKGVEVALGSLFRFGYPGTGTKCLAVWMETAGISATHDALAAVQPPRTVRNPAISAEAIAAARQQAESKATKRWWQFWK